MSGNHLSKSFFELIKAIGEARTKMDEDRIITAEVAKLKVKLSQRDVKDMREMVVRMIYCEMLGHDASFGHIHAINLATQNPSNMRIGFLACSLCLPEKSELLLLLINSLVAGLQSQSFVVQANTLTAICQLADVSAIPVLENHVNRLTAAKEAIVRKKSAMVLRYFWTLDRTPRLEKFKKLLCDRDPSVMGASLHMLYDVVSEDPQNYKELISSFVSILKQIVDHQLPRDYDYHRIPAPWVQLKLLKILAKLGEGDQRASEDMYTILDHVMKRADVGINIGYAIIYQCILTIVTIYPKNDLLAKAAQSTKRFFTSENPNLKYLGVKALGKIVKINPSHGVDQQAVILECLDHEDVTLKRRTLDLLYHMTNTKNMAVIVERLIVSLQETRDRFARQDLILKITKLLERFCEQPDFYIDMMHLVLKEGGDLVPEDTINTIIQTISLLIEVNGDDIVGDDETITEYIMKAYWDMLQQPLVDPKHHRIFSWVIGEYGHLSKEILPDDLLTALWDSEVIPNEEAEDYRPTLIEATTKLCSRLNLKPNPRVLGKLTSLKKSLSIVVHECAVEFFNFLEFPNSKIFFPSKVWNDEVNIDDNLSFLDDLVATKLAAGMRGYSPPDDDDHEIEQNSLKMVHREENTQSLIETVHSSPVNPEISLSEALRMPQSYNIAPTIAKPSSMSEGLPPTARKWGPVGYTGPLATKKLNVASAAPVSTPYQISGTADTITTAPVVPAPSQPAPAVEKPALNEEEQFAKALFGGGSSNLRRKRVKKRSTYKRGAKSRSPPLAASKAPESKPAVDDLLDLSALTTTAASSTAAPPAAASPDPILDLFGSITAQPSKPSVPEKNKEPLDFLGDIMPTAAPAAEKKTGDIFDLLGDASASNLVNMGVPSQQKHFSVGVAGVSPLAQAKLAQLRKQKDVDDVVSSDLNLRVGCYKAYPSVKSYFCLFLTNLSNVNMGVQVSLATETQNIKVGIDMDGEPKPKLLNAYTASVEIAPTKTSVQFVSFGPKNPMAPTSAVVQGHVKYTMGTMKESFMQFKLGVDVGDLLRPATINTPQFGVNWKALGNDMRAQVRTSFNDMPTFQRRLQFGNFQVVEIIGQEVIAAAQIRSMINSAHVVPVLLHCQFQAGIASLNLKSPSIGVSAKVIQHVQNAIA